MDARPRDRRLGSRSLVLVALAMATAAASCAGGSGGTGHGRHRRARGTGGTTEHRRRDRGTGGSNTGTGGTTSGTGGTNVGTGGVTGTGGATSTGGTHRLGRRSSTGGTTGTGGSAPAPAARRRESVHRRHRWLGRSERHGRRHRNGRRGRRQGRVGGCPSNATFCSGFESPGLPTGAVYMVNAAPGDWSRDFAIDTTQHHAGASSLLVKNSALERHLRQLVPDVGGARPRRARSGYGSGSRATCRWAARSHNAFAGPAPSTNPNDLMIRVRRGRRDRVQHHGRRRDLAASGYGRIGGSTNPYTSAGDDLGVRRDLVRRHRTGSSSSSSTTSS